MRSLRITAAVLLSLIGTAYAAQQTIITGSAPNTGFGDPAYTAFQKVNSNFADLYSFLYAPITGPVTIASGTNTSAIAAGALTNGMLASMPATTVKCNPLVLAAAPADCTPTQIAAMLTGLITVTGGTGTVNTLNFIAPSWMTITPSITGDNQTVTLGSATVSANQVLASPNGSNGPLAPRQLASADLPNYTGMVTSASGVTTIQPSVVTNAMLTTAPANTLKGNCSSATASVTDCTVTQINQMIGYSGGSSGGGLSNQVDLCTYAGVDATGATDSRAAVVAALASVAGTNKELEVNCPVKITIGYDQTKPIFIRSGTNLRFGAAGVFIVDNNTIPAFVFDCMSYATWVSPRFEWIGSMPLNNGVAPFAGVAGSFNDTQLKANMATYCGNTFSGGGSALWSGPNNLYETLLITGTASHLNFIDAKFFVPDTANASQFMPGLVAINAQFKPNTLVTSATPNGGAAVGSSAQLATDINFIRPVADGFYMGFVGIGVLNIDGARFYRYSDLQDASYLTNTVGANQGGVGYWTSPPHAIYLTNGDPSLNARLKITDTIDYGIYVGGTQRRSTTSGSILSLKVQLDQGNVIDGYISYRPDGLLDVLKPVISAPGEPGGVLRNVYGRFDSSTATTNGGVVWGVRWPESTPVRNVTVQNLTLVDVAVAPATWPMGGSPQSTNQDVSLTGIKVYLNDWPVALTGPPSATWGGTNVNYEAEYHFANFNAPKQYVGVVQTSGSTYCFNCNFEVKVFGWRQPTAIFSAPLAVGATSAVLASSWLYESGTYSVTFSDQEVRYVSFTNGSTAMGSFAALTGAATTAATIGNMLTVDFNAYKVRMLVNYNAGSFYSRAHVYDVSNGYDVVSDNSIETESWTQFYTGTPTGASQNTNIQFPNTMAIDRVAVTVPTALSNANGLTSFNMGWSSNNSALKANVGITAGTNPGGPITAPIALPTNPTQVFLYPVGGNFGTTGKVIVGIRGVLVQSGQ